ncbi:MAG: hypothetical protein MUP63_00855 [Candidatus Nanohaloarchaeota archaeon QJJ-7]|nr:hypothetical protein [Candidatus Nanohaloarchaeota archaeon QJJ-7]
MKRIVLLSLFILLASSAVAFEVGVQVQPSLNASLDILNQSGGDESPKVWLVEAMNTGSQSFVGRFHLEVVGDELRAGKWSDEFVLEPGSGATRELAFYSPPDNGSLNASVTLRYGPESSEVVRDRFRTSTVGREEGFEVVSSRANGKDLILGIAVPEGVGSFFLSVEGRADRRFSQVQVKSPGRYEQVAVPYSPEIDKSEDAAVEMFDSEGRYYYTGEHEFDRFHPLVPVFDSSIDYLRGVLHVIMTRGI